MKRYNDLSHEELIALTDEQIETLIELEIAYEGIIPIERPAMIEIKEPDIKPAVEAFSICGLVLLDEKDAIAISKMNVMHEHYDYGFSDKYKMLKPFFEEYGNKGILSVKYYEAKDIDGIKDILKQNQRNKNINASNNTEYQKYAEQISKIRGGVWQTIRDANELQQAIDNANKVYKKHLELAEGNEEIAKNFFRNAYKNDPDMIEKILGEKPESEKAQ